MSPPPSLCDLLIQRYNVTNFVPMLSLWDFFRQKKFRPPDEHRTLNYL